MKLKSRKLGKMVSGLLAAVMLVTSLPQPASAADEAGIDGAGALESRAAMESTSESDLDSDSESDFAEALQETGTTDGSGSEEAPETYTVTFRLMGHGEDFVRTDIKAGSLLEQTEDLRPADGGFYFENWYVDDTFSVAWNLARDTVENDLTLYAKWVELEPGTIVITFDLGGHGVNWYQYLAPDDSPYVPADPHDPGYRFLGWYTDADCTQKWNFGRDGMMEDTTLYSKWEETTYTVRFYFWEVVPEIVRTGLKVGSLLEETPDLWPEIPGYVLEGWYASDSFGEFWDFEKDTIQGDLLLYAKLTKLYTVTFDLSGHGEEIVKADIREGGLLELTPDLYPTAPGYEFDGWYQDPACEEPWDFANDTVRRNITLYAKWTPTYTVTFDLSGHGADIVKTDVRKGSLLERTADLWPVDEGFYFENWYQDAEFIQMWDFRRDTVEGDTTLYAKWEAVVAGEAAVAFDLCGHGEAFYRYVPKGSVIGEVAEPEDTGYYFAGWYRDREYTDAWDTDKDQVAENLTLYAKWRDASVLRVERIQPQRYTGKALKPEVYVYSGSEDAPILLKAGKDYTIRYKNNVNTNAFLLEQEKADADGTWQKGDTEEGGSNGTGRKVRGGFNPVLPHVVIEGKGDYSGKIYMNFMIERIAIGDENHNAAAGVTLNCIDQFETGTYKKDQETLKSVKYLKTLKAGQDYTVSITDGQGVREGSLLSKEDPIFREESGGGERTLTITGIGNYTGTIIRTIYVRNKGILLKSAKISLGSQCKSKEFIRDEEITLVPAWYETMEVEVEDAKGNVKTKKVTTYYQYLGGEWITDWEEYDGDYDAVILYKLNRKNAFTVKYGSKWLKYGEDYEIEYRNNAAVGTATMTIKGIGSYCGSKSVNFKIAGKAFNAKTVSAQNSYGERWQSKLPYNGYPQTQNVTLVSKKSHRISPWDSERAPDYVFEEGTDYTVRYLNNVNKGTATAVYTALPESGYVGSFRQTYQITAANLAERVVFSAGEETLKPIVTEDNVYLGEDANGNPKFKYVKKVESTRFLDGTIPYAKSGAELDFALYVEETNTPLVAGRDYTVKYQNNKSITPMKKQQDKWKEQGEDGKWHWVYGEEEIVPDEGKMGTLTITGKGNYTGKIVIKYQIVQGSLDMESVKIEDARAEYDSRTAEYKPKVVVRSDRDGIFGEGKDYAVTYHNNKREDVEKYLAGVGAAPTVTVTFHRSDNYGNLSGSNFDEAAVTKTVPIEFYTKRLTAKNLYVVIDNENPKELVYNGAPVTNVKLRVYYGDEDQIKAAKKDKATEDARLVDAAAYGLVRLREDSEDHAGDYRLTYGGNDTVGKNKGSVTVNGTGGYGGSVTQKFTIYRNPVSYQIVSP
ncbi:MAG: InlB B-repeat-containing protein [Muribaculum sp.]|nr:InlB B-repeat-containing protein [Muribaculum sp.]